MRLLAGPEDRSEARTHGQRLQPDQLESKLFLLDVLSEIWQTTKKVPFTSFCDIKQLLDSASYNIFDQLFTLPWVF